MSNEKKESLALAMAQIEKQFGKGAVMRLGKNEAMQVDAIPTGSLTLDVALGIGGLPRGRIIEISSLCKKKGQAEMDYLYELDPSDMNKVVNLLLEAGNGGEM